MGGAATTAPAPGLACCKKAGANAGGGDAERLFNGRLIAALKALSDAGGLPSNSRQSQCDVVLVAAALAGLALLARSGRLEALGFRAEEILGRLDSRFRTAT